VAKSEPPLSGRYALRRPIASGGYARLFEAEDLKLGRLVAIKVVAPAFATVTEATQRLAREGRIMGGIAHPNVCALTDIGQMSNGAPFLVFELLIGETLTQRLERQAPLPVDQAVRIAEQILHGLSAVHARGVVHRDIKPDNLFLVELAPGVSLVKILDFGTAHVPGDDLVDGMQLTKTGFVVGTAEYMAPEQARGVRDFDARIDVYATGVILFEMLAGERPFARREPSERLKAIGFEKAPPLAEIAPRVPRGIARAVDVALATDRERRHADAAGFVMALRAPVAPALTAVTRVLATPPVSPSVTPAGTGVAMPDTDDWDMPTRESGPPQSAMGHEFVIEHGNGGVTGHDDDGGEPAPHPSPYRKP